MQHTEMMSLADNYSPGGNSDAQAVIQNFIRSMGGNASGQGAQQKLFTTLQDLLRPDTTVSWLETASEEQVEGLMQFIPPTLASLARDDEDDETSLTQSQKKDLLKRVLRSPQFVQSLASLTFALRDGGLPSISEALNVPVQNGGFMRRGGVPLGGGEAVEAFLEGVRDQAKKSETEDDSMDTQ